jgi:hypothetical protein
MQCYCIKLLVLHTAAALVLRISRRTICAIAAVQLLQCENTGIWLFRRLLKVSSAAVLGVVRAHLVNCQAIIACITKLKALLSA